MKNNFYHVQGALAHTCKNYSAIFNNKWLLLLLVIAAGCKKVVEEPGLTGLCPIVISTAPASNATGVSINTTITAKAI